MNTIEIKVSVDTGPIDSLITKLERAVELQKQLTPKIKPTLLSPISVESSQFGVVVSWSEWPHGKVRVYSKYRRGDEVTEQCSQPLSHPSKSYFIGGLVAGQDIECHVRFYDQGKREILRSAVVTGQASTDASAILNATPTTFAVDNGQTYLLRTGIHIDSFILGGTVTALKIESSPASIKELQDNVAAIITNATDTRHQLERIDHQRNKDFVSLSKAVRSVEESISRLSHRDSLIR
ncbi:hypothetical protein [Yersinia aleksiciae]|uniref:hypothetical protein n=1 Tax=Yersinia aleksiciae TaxID=263819 RepID=UPI0011A906F6|nr:hypothetical protein [Yersinia aleksiciae]